jgi:L-fucose isomerase-like protein
MENPPIVTALPIGEFDSKSVKSEFEAIIRVFEGLEIDLFTAAPVSSEEEARRSITRLSERNPDIILLVPLRGLSAQTIETALLTSPILCLIWPIQGRFALPSSTLAVGALHDKRVPVELFYAPPDNTTTPPRIQSIIRAAKAYSRLSHSRIGIIGNLFPNLVSCRYDPGIIEARLGTTFHSISFEEIRDVMKSLSHHVQEIEQFQQDITNKYTIRASDLNFLDGGVQLHLALKQLASEYKIDGFATDCWIGFPSELGLNPCFGFIEDAYMLACEGDVMVCLSQLIVRYITGTNPFVGDLFDLDIDGILTLAHCGAPASLAFKSEDVMLKNNQRAIQKGFSTLTCRPRLSPGPVTIFRFYGKDCDKMHIATGDLIKSEEGLDLMVKIKLLGDRWDFLGQCFGNHYIVVPGDIRNELKFLCKWLRITPYET